MRKLVGGLSLLLGWAGVSYGANVIFSDCLAAQNGTRFTPTAVEAFYLTPDNVTNNVLRFEITGDLIGGQIIDLDASTNTYTTFKANSKVLQYTVFSNYSRFCDLVVGGCPFGPLNSTFAFEFPVNSAFEGVSFDSTFHIIDPSEDGRTIGCIYTEVTPTLPQYVWYVLLFVIVALFAVLVVVYFMCLYLNPWTGTSNIYLSTSNYDHHHDAIRLITPGALDLLRYLQFAFFSACLNLNYPGFFPAALASLSWSTLLFGTNFVNDNGPDKLDINLDNNVYPRMHNPGMERVAGILQLNSAFEVWPSFIVWFLSAFGAIILLSVIVVITMAIIWRVRRKAIVPAEAKKRGLAFVGGVAIRMIFTAFSLPLLTYSFYQMVVARSPQSPTVADVFGGLVLAAWIIGAGYLTFRVVRMEPMKLFNDLPTMLLVGPLYNTYQEAKARFFIIDLAVTLLRGMTIGGIQDSGLAQIALLATIEVAYCTGVACAKPYHPAANMNLITVLISLVKIVQIFLLLPFIASLDVGDATRGWLAYVILIIHALIFVMWFVRAIQVLIELIARLSGAGASATTGEHAYGMKQLSKRKVDEDAEAGAGMSGGPEMTAAAAVARPAAPLLINTNVSDRRMSGQARDDVFDDVFVGSPTSDHATTTPLSVHHPPAAASAGYYRRPRRRMSSHDWAYGVPSPTDERKRLVNYSTKEEAEPAEGQEEEEFTFIQEQSRKRRDYAVREADIYYTKRGSDDRVEYEDLEDGSGSHKHLSYQGHNPNNDSDDDYGHDEKLNGNNTNARVPPKGGIISGIKGTMSVFKDSIRKMTAPQRPQEKGFEVLRRPRPIIRDGIAPNSQTSQTVHHDHKDSAPEYTGLALSRPGSPASSSYVSADD